MIFFITVCRRLASTKKMHPAIILGAL